MSEPIDQLDPFKDDRSEFKTKEIRHSHSRKRSNPFIWLINPKDEKAKKHRMIFIAVILLLVIAGSAVFFILSSGNSGGNGLADDNPLINPTGREASGEYTDNLNDPELRESEHQKLVTVMSLTIESDWDYARALFETIFPEYLDSCDKYDYYRVSLLLDDNLDDFEIARDRATERMQSHLSKCDRLKD
ncbi:hypothetical protein IKG20_00375 [Candidatus Saccharibacteria bacterium]|nr:hypothetical protein [Candidatus Saccharibacteria bacterium]